MTTRQTVRPRVVGVVVALALMLAACGSDGDSTAEDVDAETSATEADTTTTETTAAETTATETETTEAETETSEAETTEATGGEEAAATDGIPIELGEWFVSDPGELTAGSYTFALSNTGENPHTLAIARGTSYEELPQLDNGAVDIDALGDDFLGTTDENVESGSTGSIDFDLDAGDYVFFCPIQFGPNSHAAQGQVLSVTVG